MNVCMLMAIRVFLFGSNFKPSPTTWKMLYFSIKSNGLGNINLQKNELRSSSNWIMRLIPTLSTSRSLWILLCLLFYKCSQSYVFCLDLWYVGEIPVTSSTSFQNLKLDLSLTLLCCLSVAVLFLRKLVGKAFFILFLVNFLVSL